MPEPSTAPGTFAALGLPVVLVHALGREGIRTPFPIQSATIPDVLAGRDVLGRAPTGSGKTLAFGLPMLVCLAGAPSAPRRPRGLILAPTRELAAQIERALDPAALALGLRLGTAVGGLPIKRQAERLARGVDLLIGTPGRLADLIAQQALALDAVRITAIDEADHLAELGFLPQVQTLVDQIPAGTQHLLFSATLDDAVDDLVHRYLRDPVTHASEPIPETAAAAPAATHHLLFLRKADKRDVVAEVAARAGRTLLFVRTQHSADKLTARLREIDDRAPVRLYALAWSDVDQLCASRWNLGALYLLPELRGERFASFRLRRDELRTQYEQLAAEVVAEAGAAGVPAAITLPFRLVETVISIRSDHGAAPATARSDISDAVLRVLGWPGPLDPVRAEAGALLGRIG
ncbi:DEAD/DEAH box helicase [Nocardia cyriacigeorgica]|uniref:DEAD/DEAH box helicase n=1 Tax=Nocardia cyriacigeorgica TaxID=135487 RepID=UPI002B4AAFFE|nr:DEAD/DEAH box helicase [Nocardia cyriacigeorgica]